MSMENASVESLKKMLATGRRVDAPQCRHLGTERDQDHQGGTQAALRFGVGPAARGGEG
jgi:hypothetical protein